MTQALYAHMNNKIKKKKESTRGKARGDYKRVIEG
jgi:hypothetical protein